MLMLLASTTSHLVLIAISLSQQMNSAASSFGIYLNTNVLGHSSQPDSQVHQAVALQRMISPLLLATETAPLDASMFFRENASYGRSQIATEDLSLHSTQMEATSSQEVRMEQSVYGLVALANF